MKIANLGGNSHRPLVTGERIVTNEGGFNTSWQRHAACYLFAETFLGPGKVLDVGCGTGHAAYCLAPRKSVGIDLDPSSLAGQPRPVAMADMCGLPFVSESFGSVISIHALEHVPDPNPALSETARVLSLEGVAVFATPNRLTFGRPNEIIDPYHFVEYDPSEFEEVCGRYFSEVSMFGIFGSERYMESFRGERKKLDFLLKMDPLRLRKIIGRRQKQILYDWGLTRARSAHDPKAAEISTQDFDLRSQGLDESLDLLAVCKFAKKELP